jgi:hypothetical protein
MGARKIAAPPRFAAGKVLLFASAELETADEYDHPHDPT